MAVNGDSEAKKDRERLLQLGIDELRRLYDGVSDAYRQLKTKALGLLAGEVALLTFVFTAQANNSGFTPPYLVYEAVFFLAGLALVITSFILFLSVVAPVKWSQPPEMNTIQNLTEWFDDKPETYLSHLKGEYIHDIGHCIKQQAVKSFRFKVSVYLLTIGVIILTLLKFGGGTINI